jgi:metallo-beta-lactamase family protein
MAEIEFLGAAQTVTGSKHLLHSGRSSVLLDCGLFQGRRRESFQRNRSLPLDPSALDAVVLSHAHIDHSGALPILVRSGYEGPIYATPATRDLCAAILLDAARIQVSDAAYVNKLADRGEGVERVEPLYTEADAERALSRFVGIPYERRHPIADGVHLTFLDAGHVLGSAVSVLDIGAQPVPKRLVFTGDLGRRGMPILRDPMVADGAHAMIVESTYGDRLHPSIESMHEELGAIVRRVHARGGKIVIPSFALERAQEVLYALAILRRAGKIPPLPVYIDSPLTTEITAVFRQHPQCYDEEASALLNAKESPFAFEGLRYVTDAADSKAVGAAAGPSIVISASGMCEAGRVLHHLKATIGNEKNAVVIVGFQAPHTLGRRLVERRPRVRIFGVEHDLRAEVVVLNGFSAHADQHDLVEYVEATRARGALESAFLVHGEPAAQAALRALLLERGVPKVTVPAPGERLAF